MNQDKAGKDYWDQQWSRQYYSRPIDSSQKKLNSQIQRAYCREFSKAFEGVHTEGLQLLEIGAARSEWLPYFAKAYGFKVTGLDYSHTGCQQTEQLLFNSGTPGIIICSDLFSPPAELLGFFDVVVSFGVVEHFQDTVACLNAFARFLKPNGLLITSIPNMTGVVGWLQHMIDKKTYELHVALNLEKFQNVHEKAGLKVDKCFYFMSTAFGIMNTNNLDPSYCSTKIKRFAIDQLSRISKIVWLFENHLFQVPATRLFSPYLFCLARKS